MANDKRPKGVLESGIPLIDLDIGFVEYETGGLPDYVKDLLPEI